MGYVLDAPASAVAKSKSSPIVSCFLVSGEKNSKRKRFFPFVNLGERLDPFFTEQPRGQKRKRERGEEEKEGERRRRRQQGET